MFVLREELSRIFPVCLHKIWQPPPHTHTHTSSSLVWTCETKWKLANALNLNPKWSERGANAATDHFKVLQLIGYLIYKADDASTSLNSLFSYTFLLVQLAVFLGVRHQPDNSNYLLARGWKRDRSVEMTQWLVTELIHNYFSSG